MFIDKGMDKEYVAYVCVYTHTHTVKYYSAIKRNETGSFVEMWMNLESVLQSEVNQKEKNKYCVLTHICGI